MQLEAVPEMRVFRTSLKFGKRILPERVEAAKGAKALREPRDLLAGPVVLALHLHVLVFASESRTPMYVTEGKHQCAPNPSSIELRK
jgi:hypothetical protein